MAKTVLSVTCAYCKKEAHEKSRLTLGKEIIISLTCGHSLVKSALAVEEEIGLTSRSGKTAFPFQLSPTGVFTTADGVEHSDSVHFIEAADGNALCLHEQGLGKTVIAAILLKRIKEMLPCLVVVKSGLRAQWFAELFDWAGHISQVITSSQEKPHFDLFDVVIVSVDTLRLIKPPLTPSVMQLIKVRGEKRSNDKNVWGPEICARFKSVIIDESQKIKNPSSARTQAIRRIVSEANDGKKARVICLSGTNIEKHAGEFFVTLNLVRPEIFPHQSTYVLNHCEVDRMTGKVRGLRRPEHFKDLTKDFIIRYKREDVLPDLPKVFRHMRLAELEGSALDAYKKVVTEFQGAMDEEVLLPMDILGYLSTMRHITGIAKTDAAVEYVEEFLLSSDRKLVLFVHHKQVSAIILGKLESVMRDGAFAPPLLMNSEMTMEERTQCVEDFKKPENRILIASTLIAGEGLNMQFCSDCLFVEQEWNPSQEEQAEGRFPRPGSTADKINAAYLIAAGTIDDFMVDIKTQKRINLARTLDYKEWPSDAEESVTKALVDILMTKGLMRWKL